MPIEVRQMLIKSTVESTPAPTGRDFAPSSAALERLRADILSECKEMLEEKLQSLRER